MVVTLRPAPSAPPSYAEPVAGKRRRRESSPEAPRKKRCRPGNNKNKNKKRTVKDWERLYDEYAAFLAEAKRDALANATRDEQDEKSKADDEDDGIDAADNIEDRVKNLSKAIEVKENGAYGGRSYTGKAMVPDEVLQSDESELDPALREALENPGEEMDELPGEINVEWACLAASLLEPDEDGDIRPAVLNRIWHTLNCFLTGSRDKPIRGVAQFMIMIMFVNGLEFRNIPTLRSLLDRANYDHSLTLHSFVAYYFKGNWELFKEKFNSEGLRPSGVRYGPGERGSQMKHVDSYDFVDEEDKNEH